MSDEAEQSVNQSARMIGVDDKPIECAKDDELDRGDFARRVAQIIEHSGLQDDSIVSALIGPWGSGKTSTLALIADELEKASRTTWRTVEFNPWMLPSVEGLAVELFSAISQELPDTDKAKGIRKKLAGLTAAVAPATDILTLVGMSARSALEGLSETLAGDTSLAARHRELRDELAALDINILVVVDDMDRLHPDELLFVFKLVRLVGRLPNVHYLLAFDEQTLIDVLANTDIARDSHPRALSYLDKMVQLRFDLPPMHEYVADDMLTRLLGQLGETFGIGIDENDQERLNTTYQDCMKPMLRQPRSIKRYVAQIGAAWPLVAAEVNFVDFALITFLRTFYPDVYRRVAAHKDSLVPTQTYAMRRAAARTTGDKSTSEVDWREFVGQHVGDLREADRLMELLTRLFPNLSDDRGVLAGVGFSDVDVKKRIGSPEYFDRYFHFGVPPSDIRDSEIVAVLEQLEVNGPQESAAAVTALMARHADLTVEKLCRYADESSIDDELAAELFLMLEPAVPHGNFISKARLLLRRAINARLVKLVNAGRLDVDLLSQVSPSATDFMAEAVSKAMSDASASGREMDAPMVTLVQRILPLVRRRLDARASKPLSDTNNVMSLIMFWRVLEPNANHGQWLRRKIDDPISPWTLEDVLAMMVTLRMSGGYAPDDSRVYDLAHLSMDVVDMLLGLKAVIDELEIGDEPEPPAVTWQEGTPITFEHRRQRAMADLWEQSRRMEPGEQA